jgi:NDP-sugar pyrophosphorylase family protein
MAIASSPADAATPAGSAELPLTGIDAVILAGGLGTRLSTVLPDQQKVLAEVAGQPFLGRVVDFYAAAGAARIVLALGHRAVDVQHFARRHASMSELIASVEPEPRGTGGALRHALPALRSATVLVANGDSFAAVDLRAIVHFHHQRHSAITLALAVADDTARYGRVEVDSNGVVRSFVEKAAHAPEKRTVPGYINAGIYLMDRSIIETLPPDTAVSLEREVFPLWIGRGLHAVAARVPFIDIGTPDSWAAADAFFAALETGGMRP